MIKDKSKAEKLIRRDLLAIESNLQKLGEEAEALHRRLAEIDQIKSQLSASLAEWKSVLKE